MEKKILKDFYNGLFSRREVQVAISVDVTPSMQDAKKAIADEFSVNESLVRIRNIKGRFGSREFIVVADIYDSVEEFARVVKKTKQEIDAEKKAEEERLKAEEEKRKAEEEAKANAEKEDSEESSEEKVEESQ